MVMMDAKGSLGENVLIDYENLPCQPLIVGGIETKPKLTLTKYVEEKKYIISSLSNVLNLNSLQPLFR